MTDVPRYWFPAKRYGWGWGPPATWEGWVVMLVWAALQGAAVLAWLPEDRVAFFAATALLTLALLLACWLKGEPPSWRWGPER